MACRRGLHQDPRPTSLSLEGGRPGWRRLGYPGHAPPGQKSYKALLRQAVEAPRGSALATSFAAYAGNTQLGFEDTERIRESLPSFQARSEQSWRSRALDALLASQPDTVLQLAQDLEASEMSDAKRYWRARAHLDLGQAKQALESLLLLHAQQPDNVEFAFFLQECAEELALESLELFASIEPNSYRTHQLRAEYHASRGDGDQAIAEYTKALALAPGATQLHLAIGTLYLSQREFQKALAAFQAELKNDAYSVAARARMGEAYHVIGNIAEAEGVLQQAIAINPAAAAPHKTLGRVYFKKREYQKSVEHLQLALRFGIKHDEDLYYHLGRAHRMLGNSEEAQKNLAIVSQIKESRRSIAQERLESSQERSAGSKPD